MNEYDNFTQAYFDLIKDVYTYPDYVCSPRGSKIKESLCVQFKITNPLDRIPYVKSRNFSVSYMIAELVWYMTGNDQTKWISNYSNFWSKISDDGVTANSAYGARIFKPHKYSTDGLGWSQWDYVLNELSLDNDSRRAVIHIRSPYDSMNAKLDVPCTLTLQFFIRNDKLSLAVNMRSSDLILGLALDVPAFTMFQEMMANDLTVKLGREIKLGDYIHTSNSLHIYEKHFDMAEKIIIEANSPELECNTPPMTPLPMSRNLPLELIQTAEGMIRSSNDTDSLSKKIDSILKSNIVLGDYWIDWIFILASHRAKKLGNDNVSKQFIEQCHFSGYNFFSK